MRVITSVIAPSTAFDAPASPEPAPRGTTGTPCRDATCMTATTSCGAPRQDHGGRACRPRRAWPGPGRRRRSPPGRSGRRPRRGRPAARPAHGAITVVTVTPYVPSRPARGRRTARAQHRPYRGPRGQFPLSGAPDRHLRPDRDHGDPVRGVRPARRVLPARRLAAVHRGPGDRRRHRAPVAAAAVGADRGVRVRRRRRQPGRLLDRLPRRAGHLQQAGVAAVQGRVRGALARRSSSATGPRRSCWPASCRSCAPSPRSWPAPPAWTSASTPRGPSPAASSGPAASPRSATGSARPRWCATTSSCSSSASSSLSLVPIGIEYLRNRRRARAPPGARSAAGPPPTGDDLSRALRSARGRRARRRPGTRTRPAPPPRARRGRR